MMCRAYLLALAGKPGTVINLSSGASSGIAPGFSGYAIGKMAINRYVYSPYLHSIRVLTVAQTVRVY